MEKENKFDLEVYRQYESAIGEIEFWDKVKKEIQKKRGVKP
jgi:hypothetical protein